MLDWVLGKKKKKKGKKRKRPAYEKAKEIAAKGTLKERRELASHDDLEPELLYYSASDESPEVRREVARNEGTPLQADKILCEDADGDVRCELAHKIGKLVPSFTEEEQERLTEMAIEVLEVLASDELPKVRAIIAEEIKSAKNVPVHIVQKLARDVEEIVAAPVLRYSPMLSAQDLLEIIAGGVGELALAELSKRQDLMEPVAAAIVENRSIQAARALLNNKTASISDDTLDVIATIAVGAVDLHKPMVNRGSLPLRTIRRIAGFVSSSLVEILIKNSGLDEGLASEIRQTARRRIDKGDFAEEEAEPHLAEEEANKLFAEGKLNDEVIVEAAVEKNIAFVHHALTLMSGIPASTVRKIMGSESGKAVVALAWRACLGMQTAMVLQKHIARIRPKSMFTAAGDDFPMAEEELEWYIEYFDE